MIYSSVGSADATHSPLQQNILLKIQKLMSVTASKIQCLIIEIWHYMNVMDWPPLLGQMHKLHVSIWQDNAKLSLFIVA